MIQITLKRHIEDLRVKSYGMPLPVPTNRELAKVAGCTPSAVSDIMRNKVVRLNLRYVDAFITELRSRGFTTNVSDIIEYIDLSPEQPKFLPVKGES